MKKLISRLRNPKVIRIAVLIMLVGLIVGGYYFYEKFRDRVRIDNSLVAGTVINIMPGSSGKLNELDAVEGHSVKTGDVLAVVGAETIRAKTDGIIIMAADQVGGNVSPTVPIIQMVRPQDLRIAGTLDENKGLDLIKVGQPVSFTIDAYPNQMFWGYVDEISPSAKSTQAAFNISSERPTQQFVIYAKFDSGRYPQIRNGMSAKMTIYTK